MVPAPAAGWYPSAPDDDFVRYWDGFRWSDHTVPAGSPLPPPAESSRIATGRPRRNGARAALTIGRILLVLFLSYLITEIPLYAMPASGLRDFTFQLLNFVVSGVAFGWMAEQVGYRWRDIFFLLIPFYGIYWAFRIAWRHSYLPFADWPPRSEDAGNWRQVPHPTSPGELCYVPSRRD